MKQRRRDLILINLIGAKLRRIRQFRGLSMEAVFEDTKINVARVECGAVNFSISTLSSLLNYYNITPTEFFSDGFQDYNSKSKPTNHRN